MHRRAGTQYVVVRTESSLSRETIRDRLTLELDGEPQPYAERQLVPWQHDTVDFGFAVSKTATFETGRILFDQTALHSLADSTITRLNNPPVFEISAPAVSPSELEAGERTDATVRFSLSNSGEGPGTFGASLKGNAVSGAQTVTARVSPSGEREVVESVRVIGDEWGASVRLDWGSGEWTGEITVVGAQTSSETTTATS